MAKIKILIVDDHAIMRDGIRALLSIDDDIEIVGEASEGREALEKAQKLKPDVVLMDIAMPGMDGLEATRRITEKNKKLKVLILTQYDKNEYVLSSIKAGAVGYISKRALGSDLVSAIHTVYRGDSILYSSAATDLIENYQKQSEKTESHSRLTAREAKTLRLIAEGHTSKVIAEMFGIHLRTVTGDRINIMKKLDLHSRTELIRYALEKGLVRKEQ
ncbi:response regulator [Chloroflexota bacterium]